MSYPVDHEKLSKIDPEFENAWNSKTRSHDVLGEIHDIRKMIDTGKTEFWASLGPFPGTTTHEKIPMRDGHHILARIYTPPNSTGREPLVVWYHGGGFCLGDLDTDEVFCRQLCLDIHSVIVSVDYRLAPEHPFPTPVCDCWDALQWIASNVSSLNADATKGFILGGSSAGGNITAVLSHLARDSSMEPPLTGVYLGIPAVVHPDAVPEKYLPFYRSYSQNKDAPILSRESMDTLTGQYKPTPTDPLYSPLLWPGGHSDLPPTYFQVCGLDPLRDDGLIYENVLREEYGTKTKIDIYPGVPQAFMAAFPDLVSSRRFFDDSIAGFTWLLEPEKRSVTSNTT